MEIISCKEARDHMAEIINKAMYGHKKFTLMRRESPVAVILSFDEWKKIEKALDFLEDYFEFKEAEKNLDEIDREGTISLEEFKKGIGL